MSTELQLHTGQACDRVSGCPDLLDGVQAVPITWLHASSSGPGLASKMGDANCSGSICNTPLLLGAGGEGAGSLWSFDFEQRSLVKQWPVSASAGGTTAFATSQTGRFSVAGSDDGVVRLQAICSNGRPARCVMAGLFALIRLHCCRLLLGLTGSNCTLELTPTSTAHTVLATTGIGRRRCTAAM